MAYSKTIKEIGCQTKIKKPIAIPAVSVAIPEVLDWIERLGAKELKTCFPVSTSEAKVDVIF